MSDQNKSDFSVKDGAAGDFNSSSMIVDYLYGDLNLQEKQKFEQQMALDPKLAEKVEQERQFNRFLQPGTQPYISEQRLQGVRWTLKRKLRQAQQQKPSLLSRVQLLWSMPVSFKYQFASVVGAFTLGLMISNHTERPDNSELPIAQQLTGSPALALASDDDFHITDLEIKSINAQTGDVEVVYSLASRTLLDSNLANQKVKKLLASTMKNDVRDATRLDLVELLKNHASDQSVRDALSYSLLNDPNPGVRVAAAESLAKLSNDSSVRKVLLQALQSDQNSGVRVEAFQALIQHLEDKDTLEGLKKHGPNDSNPYIRNQVKTLLNKNQSEISI